MTRYSDFGYGEILRMIPYEAEIFVAQSIKAMRKEKEARKNK